MEVVYSRCCGLDVHKKSISACVIIREHGKAEKLKRRFGTFTWELQEMAEWLTKVGVKRATHLLPALGGFSALIIERFLRKEAIAEGKLDWINHSRLCGLEEPHEVS